MTARSASVPARTGNTNGFAVEPPGRRVRVPQLLIAVLLVLVSALAALVLLSRATAREVVLTLAVPLARGQVLGAQDVRLAYVGTDDPLASLPPERLPALVGQAALVDLPAGTVLTETQFAGPNVLGPEEGVVGLALSPGEYPTRRLAVGDLVDVIDPDATDGLRVVAHGAEVFDIAEIGNQGQRFVSLRLSSEAATEVAGAAVGRLRLVLVGSEDQP